MPETKAASEFIAKRAETIIKNNTIKKSAFDKYEIKRGLRNPDGTGVLAGVTRIGNIYGYYLDDGERVPTEGKLLYRGIDVSDIVSGFLSESRFGYEESAYLLLFGELPDKQTLDTFRAVLAECRELPDGFTEDMVLAAPSKNIMNKLARSVLALYSYDDEPEPYEGGIGHELNRALTLIARCPVIVANAYAAKRHYFDKEGLFLHRPNNELSIAENFLYSVRHDNSFSWEEAQLLDLCMVLHAEHGGGNNSAFACRVLSSSGTDIYSAISAAIGSLKGPRHGGANEKVTEMFEYIKRDVKDPKDDGELTDYLRRILRREAGNGDGLIYGMGHAVYTKSDPRAVCLKSLAKNLARSKGMLPDFELFESVERLTPLAFSEVTGQEKILCANVDMYSGLVYKMLKIPQELYTPLFAISRMAGWCAHRIEEYFNSGRIIRPAYKAITKNIPYVKLGDRK